jgi:hypothetical protein
LAESIENGGQKKDTLLLTLSQSVQEGVLDPTRSLLAPALLGCINFGNFLNLLDGILPVTIGQVDLPLDLRVFILELESHLGGGKLDDDFTHFNLLLYYLILLLVR